MAEAGLDVGELDVWDGSVLELNSRMMLRRCAVEEAGLGCSAVVRALGLDDL